MDYQRLMKIDEEIESLKKQLDILRGGQNAIIIGDITFETNSSLRCSISAWRKNKFTFEVLRKDIISKIENHIKDIKKEKNAILNKKWYQIWK